MGNAFIRCEDVYFHYGEEAEMPNVLNGISLEIEKGEFVAILGHNGSGKSTLAKMFNAILIPSSGNIFVDSINTRDEEKLFSLRRQVGMVFQNPDNQLVATVVEEDVAFAPENLGIEPLEIRRRVDDALKTVGMYDYRLSQPHKLSGGQKQRVAIAGVLAMHPSCIVLDEPTAMLDPKGRAQVMDTVKALKDEGITVILITHYMEEAALADRVIVLNDGYVALDGTPKEVFVKKDELISLGLDVPEITRLCMLLNDAGVSVPRDIVDSKEAKKAILKLFGGK